MHKKSSKSSIRNKLVSAIKWSAVSGITSSVMTPLILIVTARILTPKDFGVVGAAGIIISFSQIFWDTGLSKALVQRDSDIDETCNIVFWTNLFLGLLIYFFIYLSSNKLSLLLFKDIRVAQVMKVLGLQIIIMSLGTVHRAVCERELDFKKLFWIKLVTTSVPGIVSIPLALYGYGYWALVGGTLTGSIAQVLILWMTGPWRPGFCYKIRVAKALFRFSFWIYLSSMLGWFFLWADSLIVGAWLDTQALGLYRTGNQFVMLIFGAIVSPVMPVIFSSFSKIQNQREIISPALKQVIKTIALISIPAGTGLFLINSPLETAVFGIKWKGVGIVIGILGLKNAVGWLVAANTEVYRAIGKPEIEFKIMAISGVLYFVSYFITIRYGLTVFLWNRLAVACMALFIHMFYSKRYLDIDIINLFSQIKTIAASTLLMVLWNKYIIVKWSNGMDPNNKLLITIISCMLIYISSLVLIDGGFVKKTVSTFLPGNKS